MIGLKLKSVKMYHSATYKTVAKASNSRLPEIGVLVEAEAKRLLSIGGGSEHNPSPKGKPPHTQSGELKNSVGSAVLRKLGSSEPSSVIIGPTKISKQGVSIGHVHEFGGVNHPKRPFMKPALLNVIKRVPEKFKGLDFRVAGGKR